MKLFKKLFLIVFLGLSSDVFLQTTLSPGDLMIVTVNSDGDKNFDFVPLVNLASGTVIKFTDDAWDQGDVFRDGEGIITFTASTAYSAGSVIYYTGTPGGEFSSSGSFNPANGSDNILVYQGTETNPTFIYGIGWGAGTFWITNGSAETDNSYIPSGLSESNYTIVSLGSTDNYQYNAANSTSDNKSNLKALISDVNNWASDNTTAFEPLSATFTIESTNDIAVGIVIAEIYVGGGNSGATYTHDYVVLYNPTGSSIDVSNHSIQYESSTGDWSSINKINLTGSVLAGSYYLIKGSGGGTGEPLPVTENVFGTLGMSTSSGKVALVSNQDNITGIGDADIVDFIGYGSANEYEGTAVSAPGDNGSSLRRRDNNGFQTYGSDGSGWDTDDNYFDFYEESDIATNEPLPVELTSFTASLVEEEVQLNWETATEVNNYGFDVERTIQNSELEIKNWEILGFVPGHGNSNSPKSYVFVDENPPAGDLEYRLKQIDTDGKFEYYHTNAKVSSSSITDVKDFSGLPTEFALEQNYPNPFNPSTAISYKLSEISLVQLVVYDLLGREVAVLVNQQQQAGNYNVNFDASNLTSGMYLYKLTAGEFTDVKKLVLMK